MFAIHALLQCPKCRSGIAESLKCTACGEQYRHENGVYVMINRNVSKKEWAWDPNAFADTTRHSRYNEESRKAMDACSVEMAKRIESFGGIVCDVATGMGANIDKLLGATAGFIPLATDVDPNVLSWTVSNAKERHGRDIIAIASDGKRMAFLDGTMDHVTGLAALGNIPDTAATLAEMHRILKPRGSLVMMESFVKKWSRSYWLAKLAGVDKAITEQGLLRELRNAGFINVRSTIVASAVWGKSPGDLLPIAGDLAHYAIIEAVK